jgi:hypothetical protein
MLESLGGPAMESITSAISSGGKEQVLGMVKTALGGSAGAPPVAPGIEGVPTADIGGDFDVEEAVMKVSPVTSETILSISSVYKWRNWIILGVMLWMITVVVGRYFIPNKEIKEEIEKTNTFLFGSTGLLNVIYMVWASTLLLVLIVPGIISILPKVDKMLGNINKITTAFASS